MKICVFGAGAIGGYLAGELALAGHQVCAIARGAHLAAIRSQGLTLTGRHALCVCQLAMTLQHLIRRMS
jgi:ketopantoate reductase